MKNQCNRCSYPSVCFASMKMCGRGHHRWQGREDYCFEAVKCSTMVSLILDKTSMIGNETLSDLFALTDTLLPKRSPKTVSYYKHMLLSGYFWRKLCCETLVSCLMPVSKSVCSCQRRTCPDENLLLSLHATQ